MDTIKQVSVVTGGAGFIGSNLCEALLGIGHKVFCVDNLLTGSEKNTEALKANPDFTFIKWDVTNDMPVIPAVDYVFHLASPASVPDYQKYDEETALVNSIGTRNLLKFTKAYKAKFLFTSTSEVYGDPKEHPQKETYWGHVNPVGPRSCYDESKRFGEAVTMVYQRQGLDVRIARIFNPYGPRMSADDGRVVVYFIVQGLKGLPFIIHGDGNQTRSFCYVDDMVDGLTKLMLIQDISGEIVNLGNPEEYSVKQLMQKVANKLGVEAKIDYQPLPKDDPTRRRPDIDKAKRLLNWQPKVGLDEGLDRTMAYFRGVVK